MGGRREMGGMRVGYLIVRMRRGVGYLMVGMGGRDMRMVGLAVVYTLLHLIFGSQELQILLRLMLGSFHVLDSFFHRLFLPQVILGCVHVCGCVSMCVCVCVCGGGGGWELGGYVRAGMGVVGVHVDVWVDVACE